MKRKVTPLVFLFLFSLLNSYIFAQTTITSSFFPEPYDEVNLTTNPISPITSFSTDDWTKDTISVDDGIIFALEGVGDYNLASSIFNTGTYHTWEIVTFFYDPLPGTENWDKAWFTPNTYTPGYSDFPTANLYYQKTVSGVATYIYYRKDSTGFYALGSRVLDSPSYSLINTPEKPDVLFPLDINSSVNVPFMNTTTGGGGSSSSGTYNVNVNAVGTVRIVSGDVNNPTYTNFDNCLKVVTTSVDTMKVSASFITFKFYVKTKIISWYYPGTDFKAFEPIASFSYATIRNNIDPLYWQLDPSFAWHDEFEMVYTTDFEPLVTDIQNNDYEANKVNIFPNPFSKESTISWNSTLNPTAIKIFDVKGKKVQDLVIQRGTNSIDITSQQLNNGVYVYELINANQKISSGKFIVVE